MVSNLVLDDYRADLQYVLHAAGRDPGGKLFEFLGAIADGAYEHRQAYAGQHAHTVRVNQTRDDIGGRDPENAGQYQRAADFNEFGEFVVRLGQYGSRLSIGQDINCARPFRLSVIDVCDAIAQCVGQRRMSDD